MPGSDDGHRIGGARGDASDMRRSDQCGQRPERAVGGRRFGGEAIERCPCHRSGGKCLGKCGLVDDAAARGLIRSLARRLAEDGPEAANLRAVVSETLAGEPPKKGGILAALRRSPLVGAEVEISRSREGGRETNL